MRAAKKNMFILLEKPFVHGEEGGEREDDEKEGDEDGEDVAAEDGGEFGGGGLFF